MIHTKDLRVHSTRKLNASLDFVAPPFTSIGYYDYFAAVVFICQVACDKSPTYNDWTRHLLLGLTTYSIHTAKARKSNCNRFLLYTYETYARIRGATYRH